MRITGTILVSVSFWTLVSAYKTYQHRIPNGDRVPNPCNSKETWSGVGHEMIGGYGTRNPFGVDFYFNSKRWTIDLCMTDSDGDGRTNGEELGDPDCTWVSGQVDLPDNYTLSHPGVCEPLDSNLCKSKNTWLECPDNFKCDAMQEPETFNMTVRLPSLPVPRVKTTHMCMVFDLPDGDFHVVGTTPYRDNKIVLHHVMVFGCSDEKEPEHAVGEVYECPLAFDPACRDYISAWVHGVDGECLPDMMGIRVGSQGYRKAGIQLHWENQDLLPDLYDGSGVTLYFTPKLRKFDSGILITGTDNMVIPPGQVAHTEVGYCYSECTERKFKQDIHIVGVINHMHYIGTDMKIEQLRNDTVIKVITDEHNYVYDHPTPYMFDPPVTIRPGDELRSTCIFDSTKRDNTTRAGWGYLDEMCYGFMIFYPKQAIRQPNGCTSWNSIPHCRFEMDPTVHGCDFKNVRNMSHAPTRAIYDNVMKYCKPYGPCYKECRTVVKEITSLPCYHGIMWEWQRDRIVGPFDDSNYFLDEDLTQTWNQFYAAVDLCSLNIQVERGTQTFSNSANAYNTVTSALTTSTLFAILMII